MSWTYKQHEIGDITQFPENTFGFVYITTHKPSGKSYIGKKVLFHNQKKKLGKKELALHEGKGRPPKFKMVQKESDWKTYWGSSDRLNADVAQLGEDKFTREILYLCKGRGEMSYIEAREQFDRRVLETDEYYNGIINVRVGGSDKLKQALLEQNIKAKQSNT